MNILNGIRRFFFQKASSDFDANEAFRRNQLRYNALRALDPDVLVRHLEAFQRGDICGLERVIDEFEQREDKMRIGSFKMAAAVSSKPWKVRIRQGEEENPRAKLHQEHLTKFWNRVEATDAFCRNRKGGMRLLVKQMMSAQSRVYSVHDICWKVNGDGTLNATFTHVPAWCFENRTGRLRYIRNDCDTVGAEMPDGEWLVTVGEGVGIAAAVIAMAKRLSWNDWLLFSEKCGMPVILGNTNAQRDTPAWAAMSRAIRAIAPKTGLLADTGTTLNAVSMGAGGQQTYRELVDTVDRAISALYRGGDLATQSSGPDAAGVNAQAGESELMDDDGCKMVAETLRDQVEKFVIRFELGDFEPLAEIVINPPADTDDVEREMKIDNHLAGLGVKLSKKDALARYGRTEAEDEKDALTPPQTPTPGGFGGLANEQTAKTPFKNAAFGLQNAPRGADGQGDPSGKTPVQRAENGPSGAADILKAFAKDSGPAAEAVKKLLDDPSAEAAADLTARLPDLLPTDPEMASILADAMARAMAEAAAEELSRPSQKSQPSQEELANTTDAQGNEHGEAGSGKGGQFVAKGEGGGAAAEDSPNKPPSDKADAHGDSGSSGASAKAATDDDVKAFLASDVKDFDVEKVDALLTRGFGVTDGAGNRAHFGERMKKHLEDHDQEESNRRKRRLRAGVELVKTSAPVISARDANVSCYFGAVKGKNYLVMADNTGEVFEVWDQFRRDKWQNK